MFGSEDIFLHFLNFPKNTYVERNAVQKMVDAKFVPVWARMGWGKPHFDVDGMPTYLRWEKLADAVVHAVRLSWTIASVAILLSVSTYPRFVVYSCATLFLFCTSTAYNVIGTGLRMYTKTLRNIDQAAIFVALGGAYTVFVSDWRGLLALWIFCGLGALLKLSFGPDVESFTLVSFVSLGVAPLILAVPRFGLVDSYAYPFIITCVATLTFGVFFGYMNNMRGGMVVWHVCVLAASTVFWVLVIHEAQKS